MESICLCFQNAKVLNGMGIFDDEGKIKKLKKNETLI